MVALPAGEFIGTADVNDIIPTEFIQATVEGFNLPLNIGELLMSLQAGMGYITHQFARWDNPTFPDPVRAGGETDTVARMDMNTSSSTVTPVLRGIQIVIPDEPIESQTVAPGEGIPIGALRWAVEKIMEYVDQQQLAVAQDATTTIGTAATVPSFAHWRAGLHAFRDLENGGQTVFVGNNYFWELFQNEFTTAISQFSARVPDVLLNAGTRSAFRGQLMGADNWQSGNVAIEAGGANNFFMSIGAGANKVIGHVRQRALRTEVSRGDEMQRRQSTQWTLSWADGTELLRTDGLVELLADAAA